MIDQILFMINDLYISIVFVTALTLIFFTVLYLLTSKMKRDSKRVSFLGVFVDLNYQEDACLCASALKLFYVFSLLIQIGHLETIHYIGLLEIIIFNCIVLFPSLFSLKAFFFDIAMVASIFILNSLYAFMGSTSSIIAFYIIIITVAIFIAIYAYYRFVDEVNHLVMHKKEKINEVAN